MRDLREPAALGTMLLSARRNLEADDWMVSEGVSAHELHDRVEHLYRRGVIELPDYAGDEGPLEKYGDPRRVAHRSPIERLARLDS